MTTPLQKSLLRAARQLSSSRLSGLMESLQRNLLSKPLAGGAAPGMPNLADAAAVFARGADVLKPMQDFVLPGGFASDVPPASGSLPEMVAGQFTAAAGTRPYKLFVPPALPRRPALVVMLHGCQQNATDFAAGTGMNGRAMRDGFLVLYPEQTQSANIQHCWNWFSPENQRRDEGEPSLIAGMTRTVMAEYGVDPARVYVAGLSAGGAKAAVLGVTYPDLFRAVGVHSGLACGAARDLPSALHAMRAGGEGAGRLTVPAIVFHGDKDSTVNPVNADHVAAQANGSPPVRVEEGTAPGGLRYKRMIHEAGHGQPALEEWRVHGLGHAWSGGDRAGSFTEPRGPNASEAMLRFFKNVS